MTREEIFLRDEVKRLEEARAIAMIENTRLQKENAVIKEKLVQLTAALARRVHPLQKENARFKKALEEINNPKRLKDMSFLASNPPQNAAIWEVQVIAREALAEIRSSEK
jgi:hypothetical protein